jgi:hypothetical protein
MSSSPESKQDSEERNTALDCSLLNNFRNRHHMEDLFNSFKALLYDRTSSPLFGALFVSWLIWNYKAVLVIFSFNPLIVKLDYFSDTLYPISTSFSFTHPIFILIIYPTVTAIAYIYLYPIPAKHIYRYSRNAQRELREVKQEIENETPLTIEESRKIRRDIAEIEDELKSKNEQILSLLVDADKDRNELAHKSAKLDEKELDLSRRDNLLQDNLDVSKSSSDSSPSLSEQMQRARDAKSDDAIESEHIIPINESGEVGIENHPVYDEIPFNMELSPNQNQLLLLISAKGPIYEDYLVRISERSIADVISDLGYMLNNELISRSFNEQDDLEEYSITDKGKYVTKHKT